MIIDGWMTEERVIHSLEDRNESPVDSLSRHVTVRTSCCWSPENSKKITKKYAVRALVEFKLSAVYCETHLPWCTITVYVAQVCMLNDRVCYLSSPLSAILSKFSGKTHFQQEFHLGLKIPGWSQTISNGSIGHVCENITYDEDSREKAVLCCI